MHSRDKYEKGPAANAGGSPISAGRKKIAKVLKEYKKGKLKSSSGKKVKDKNQALAIAIGEGVKKGVKKDY
jgi:hypothetical protein